MRARTTLDCDVAVVGAGFGGLGAALHLAERGHSVRVFERLGYPGGCASTFERGGCRFDAGATLLAGFGDGQLFQRWSRDHDLGVVTEALDPVVTLRTPEHELAVPRRRSDFVRRLLSLPGAPRAPLERFLKRQERVARLLWSTLDDPALLPPFDGRALLRHARRLPRYGRVVPAVGRSLLALLRRDGLECFAPLRTFAESTCQITVQCGAAEAEAPLALATLDYFHRGAVHVVDGVGELAGALTRAVEGAGGSVALADEVRTLEREGRHWIVGTRRHTCRARHVVLNLLPQTCRALLGADPGELPALDRRAAAVEEGWGACMLYLAVRPPAHTSGGARHFVLVGDPAKPFVEGNHVFCSVSSTADRDRAPDGLRVMTVSTHVRMDRLRGLGAEARADRIAGIQERMRALVAARAPEWSAGVAESWTASPRTFERFTGRFAGYVGGVPRRRGLGAYAGLFDRAFLPGLHLVGDSVFPGQSALAAALGGTRVAERIARGRR